MSHTFEVSAYYIVDMSMGMGRAQQSNMHVLLTCFMLERVRLKRFKTDKVVAMCPCVIG
jgi:hypothetical protein